MNLKFMWRVSEWEREIQQFVIVKNKLMSVCNASQCSVIDREFSHNIVKVVCGSTQLSPRGSTATLTMLWRNSWSTTWQTHKKPTSICYLEITTSSWRKARKTSTKKSGRLIILQIERKSGVSFLQFNYSNQGHPTEFSQKLTNKSCGG